MEACSDAARPRRCELVDDSADAQPDARVVWTTARDVRVEVVARPSDEEPLSRRVSFRPEDGVPERFRSIGLVVAALSAEQATAENERKREVDRVNNALAWVGVSALMGRGLDPGSLRYGASLHAGYRFRAFPIFATLGVEYATADQDAEEAAPQWTSLAAGAGIAIDLRPANIELRPRVDAVLERLSARVELTKKETASGARWLAGTGGGVEVIWPADSLLAAVGAASGRFLSGGTAIRVANEKESSFPALSYSFLLGLELRLPP